MIEIALGVENGDSIARAVITELNVLGIVRTSREVDTEDIDVVFITALLQEQVGDFCFSPTSDFGS